MKAFLLTFFFIIWFNRVLSDKYILFEANTIIKVIRYKYGLGLFKSKKYTNKFIINPIMSVKIIDVKNIELSIKFFRFMTEK